MRKGKTIYHCHGKKKGKVLKTYSSVIKAKKAHKAIMISESKRKRKKKR